MSNDLVSTNTCFDSKQFEEDNIFNFFLRADFHEVCGQAHLNNEQRKIYKKLKMAIEYIKSKGINNLETPVGLFASVELDGFDDYFDTRLNKSFVCFMAHLEADKVVCLYKMLELSFDFQDYHGNTLLHYYAVQSSYRTSIIFIRKYGANYLVENKEGLKPIDLAGINGKSALFNALKLFEARGIGKKA